MASSLILIALEDAATDALIRHCFARFLNDASSTSCPEAPEVRIINIANGQTILSGSIRSSSGLADDLACRRSLTGGWGEMMASQRVGAGEGNRTLDIQLGKVFDLSLFLLLFTLFMHPLGGLLGIFS